MKSLPKNPDLEFLKKEAKQLRALHRNGLATCCARLRQSDTSFANQSDQEILDSSFSINDAQRIIAREYGYSSWARLKHFVQSLDSKAYCGVEDKRAYHQIITDSYDDRSKVYDKSEWHRKLAIQTVDYAPPEAGHSVLDIATGTGAIAFYASDIAGSKGSVTGVDISKGMLSKCNEKLRDTGHRNLEFIYADAENLDFPVNSFNRIYCSSAFFWMSHPLAALRHWLELLKPEGMLGFNAWPEDSFLWGGGARIVLKRYGIDYTLNQVTGTMEKCRQLLELAGYENIQIHEVKSGRYISLEEAKNHFIDESGYAPGQYPHPVTNVPHDIMKQAQADFEAEVEELATDEGVWHDMTMYYVYGYKP